MPPKQSKPKLNLNYEKKLFKKGHHFIAGIDEAGRGPLAGPVVAACVLIDKNLKITEELSQINDSKKLTAKKREELFEIIISTIPNIGIGICSSKIIDKLNILQATFLAMKRAIDKLEHRPAMVLVDGNRKIFKLDLPQQTIVKGDSKVFSIAAASIIAKVTRDRIMKKYDKKYPEYAFTKHMGYGTKLHFAAIEKYGPSPIHRLSFYPFSPRLVKK